MVTGYRPEKKWVTMGTEFKPDKKFWVPMGTDQIPIHADPWLVHPTGRNKSDLKIENVFVIGLCIDFGQS